MNRTALLRACDRNLAGHAAHLHPLVPGATVTEVGDFQIADSGLHHDTYNTVSRTRFAEGFTASVAVDIARRLDDSGRPFTWWVTSGGEEDVAGRDGPEALSAAGFSAGEREDVMVVAPGDLSYPAVTSSARVERVASPEDLADYASVLAANWNPPAAEVARFLDLAGRNGAWDDGTGSTFYVTRLDEVAVAAAEVYLADGIAGIYGVATLAAYRGRGIATHMLGTVLSDFSDARIDQWVLQATDAGKPLYRRFGFDAVGSCTEFTR